MSPIVYTLTNPIPKRAWQGGHALWVHLHHVRQQRKVRARELGEAQQLAGHERDEDIQAQEHHLRHAARCCWDANLARQGHHSALAADNNMTALRTPEAPMKRMASLESCILHAR